jgi:transcriptional regulator with XRE-family HTH domain
MRLVDLQEASSLLRIWPPGQEQNMTSAELCVFHDTPTIPLPLSTPLPGRPLHRIQQVRIQQGMSLRTAARQLNMDVRAIRAQEQACTDLRLSDIYRWQQALDVPAAELLEDSGEPLSRPVAERAKMVRIMKTAASLLETADSPATRRMAENLVQQLCEVMPELKEVSPWHTVGQRRSLEELGRAAEHMVDDRSMFGYDAYE